MWLDKWSFYLRRILIFILSKMEDFKGKIDIIKFKFWKNQSYKGMKDGRVVGLPVCGNAS
jgi:hypothetical protein